MLPRPKGIEVVITKVHKTLFNRVSNIAKILFYSCQKQHFFTEMKMVAVVGFTHTNLAPHLISTLFTFKATIL